MPERRTTLLQGTLDLLILKPLATRQPHGLGVSRRIEQITGGTFVVQPGSLFPALHRLEESGWLTSTWQLSQNNRRAKYYRLTRAGRRQLREETAEWNWIPLAIAALLKRNHTAEIGIRLALRARRTTVVWMVIREALGTTLLGIACGLAASLVMGRALRQHLFSVAATDPLTLAVVSFCVLGTALLASYLPAHRAADVDPTVALRME